MPQLGQAFADSSFRRDLEAFTDFFRRDVLKGELRKDQTCLARNEQPKIPQLGHASDIFQLLIYSKHEEK